MKKNIHLFILFIALTTYGFAQDLPENPEPGTCYVRCTTPDIYENETVQVMVKPSYKKLKVIPAKYETITENVMVKAPSKKWVIIPAKWGEERITYVKKESSSTLKVQPASFGNSVEIVEVKPAYAQWELGVQAPECASNDPNDCRYWCYKAYPAEYQDVPIITLQNDATTVRTTVPEIPYSYVKKVIVEPSKVVEEEIPAEYANITRTVLVEDTKVVEEIVPAEYRMVTKEVLRKKGGLVSWKEVECRLLEYNNLNINWDLNSATLTQQAKSEIDTKLLPILRQGVSVEIASHTDSRGTKESNIDLSQRRAQAVTNYLISKGINASKITSNGYGESQLLNRCSDGVSCTEREHHANRRTQFRVINDTPRD